MAARLTLTQEAEDRNLDSVPNMPDDAGRRPPRSRKPWVTEEVMGIDTSDRRHISIYKE